MGTFELRYESSPSGKPLEKPFMSFSLFFLVMDYLG